MILLQKLSSRSEHVRLNSTFYSQFRWLSATSNIPRPRLQSAIDDQSKTLNHPKRRVVPKSYKSQDVSSRLINVYESVIDSKDDDNDLDSMMAANRKISKSMKKRMKSLNRSTKQSPDISANFNLKRSPSNTMDDVDGVIGLFADDSNDRMSDDEWYTNPDHIEAVEQWLRSEKLPIIDPDLEQFRTVRLNEEMVPRDRIRGAFARKISKRQNLRNRRKMKRKQRGNDIENMDKNELIQRQNGSISSQSSSSSIMRRESVTEDLCLQTWDSVNGRFSNLQSPTESHSMERSVRKMERGNKLKNLWRRLDGEKMDDLKLSNVSPHWLQYEGIDPVILNSLSHRLRIPSRRFAKTPQGLYSMDDGLRRTLQKVLVSEYWPTGWAETKNDQLFGQNLFSAVSVHYDRRRVLRYIANEFPLSLSVNYRILKELKHRMPSFRPKGLIDVGQGVGASTLAAIQVFGDSLKHISAVEPSPEMREFAATILEDHRSGYSFGYLKSLDIANDVVDGNKLLPHSQSDDDLVDPQSHCHHAQPLVICSFVLSEIGGGVDVLCRELDAMWRSVRRRGVIVLVEAGTVDGFNLIQFARSYLLSKYPPSTDPQVPGTFTVAPCPHDLQCPMSTENVCRFLQRVDRHQVPTRSVLFAEKKRTQALMQRNRFKMRFKANSKKLQHKGHRRRQKVKLKDRRKVNEVQFPFSYCILGKGVSPRLIPMEWDGADSAESVPPNLMNATQSEHSAYFWPRIIAPPKYRHNNLYLHLCLPSDQRSTMEMEMKGNEGENAVIHSPRVVDRLKLNHRHRASSGKQHVAISSQREGVDEREYGQIQKWLIAKSDNQFQQYVDARRAKWGELWPWPSPEYTRCQPLRADPMTRQHLKALQSSSRPKFRANFSVFKKRCFDFVHHTNNRDLIN